MTVKHTSADKRLLRTFLAPSWLSGLVVVLLGCTVLFGTIALDHGIGTAARQGLFGLESAYQQSSLSKPLQAANTGLAQNVLLNNVLLFLMWGSIGLVIFSVARSTIHEFKQIDEFRARLGRLQQTPANRTAVIRYTATRSGIRFGALACWWIMARFTVYSILPLVLGTAHTSAMIPDSTDNWTRSVLATLILMLSLHILIVLARLVTMRPRLFMNDTIL